MAIRVVAALGLVLAVSGQSTIDETNAVGMSPEMSLPAGYADYGHKYGYSDLEINGTRYQLEDIIISPYGISGPYTIRANATLYPDRETLLHPCFLSYWIQVLGATVATVLALYAPVVLISLLCVMVLIWPASAIGGFQVCRMTPGEAAWWLMAVKSFIVNIGPVVPMLLCKIKKETWGPPQFQAMGYIVYFILWSNVFWTLFFPWVTDFNFNETCKANWLTGLSLCISLVVHLLAMRKRGVPLFWVGGGEDGPTLVYGSGTSKSWLVCYTVWNALFVISLAPGLTLQDILFWCIMFALYYVDTHPDSEIEDYFAMARPIQLGMYIGISDWLDLIPYFRVAGIGLDMTRHAYFLFISTFTFLYSIYVLVYEVRLLLDDEFGRDYSDILEAAAKWEEAKEDGRCRELQALAREDSE